MSQLTPCNRDAKDSLLTLEQNSLRQDIVFTIILDLFTITGDTAQFLEKVH